MSSVIPFLNNETNVLMVSFLTDDSSLSRELSLIRRTFLNEGVGVPEERVGVVF